MAFLDIATLSWTKQYVPTPSAGFVPATDAFRPIVFFHKKICAYIKTVDVGAKPAPVSKGNEANLPFANRNMPACPRLHERGRALRAR
jgi:hypothetical protein